jgi:hypothetical protein
MTRDRGATWTEFETPLPPSRTSPALSFHAERSGYILFTGENCGDNDSLRRRDDDACQDDVSLPPVL